MCDSNCEQLKAQWEFVQRFQTIWPGILALLEDHLWIGSDSCDEAGWIFVYFATRMPLDNSILSKLWTAFNRGKSIKSTFPYNSELSVQCPMWGKLLSTCCTRIREFLWTPCTNEVIENRQLEYLHRSIIWTQIYWQLHYRYIPDLFPLCWSRDTICPLAILISQKNILPSELK